MAGNTRDPGLDVPPDILDLDEDRMRALGYAVVDRTIEHWRDIRNLPPIKTGEWADLEAQVGGPVPGYPHDVETDLRLLADTVLGHQQHGDHPRYFARVPGPSSFPAILGDWIGTGLQSISSSWVGGSGPATVELTVLSWMRDAVGLSPSCDGILQSGGSIANLSGLIVAREQRGVGAVYLSDQVHASVQRGLRAIGWPSDLIRTLPSDANFRLSTETLASAIRKDLDDGVRPTTIIATAGTTNTGVVEDLPGISSIARDVDCWLHVDGAYGGSAAISDRGRCAMPGLHLADSFVVDPHKWLFQPYGIACLFVREPGALEATFAMHPEYLADTQGGRVDLHNRGLELSRRSRALKLWLTFRAYGLPTLQRAVDRGIALAEYAERAIASRSEFDVVTPASLGILTFRATNADDDAHTTAVAHLNSQGFAAMSTTQLMGRTVFRLCTINPRTTEEDLDSTLSHLDASVRNHLMS